jgi:hypothetical protein
LSRDSRWGDADVPGVEDGASQTSKEAFLRGRSLTGPGGAIYSCDVPLLSSLTAFFGKRLKLGQEPCSRVMKLVRATQELGGSPPQSFHVALVPGTARGRGKVLIAPAFSLVRGSLHHPPARDGRPFAAHVPGSRWPHRDSVDCNTRGRSPLIIFKQGEPLFRGNLTPPRREVQVPFA